MRNAFVVSFRRAAAALFLAAVASSSAAAQIGVPAARGERPFQPRFGVGFVANVPDQLAGLSVHVVPRGFPVGFYADVKFDVESPRESDGFVDSLTRTEVEATRGDRLLSTDASFTTVNVGLMRPITSGLVLYAGAGYSNGSEFAEYVDLNTELGKGGIYWVEDTENEPSKVNFTGGAFFQLGGNFAFQIGADSNPSGFSLGISYLTPLR